MPTEKKEKKDLPVFFQPKNVSECIENPPREEDVSEQKYCLQSVKTRFQLEIKLSFQVTHCTKPIRLAEKAKRMKLFQGSELPKNVVKTCDEKS